MLLGISVSTRRRYINSYQEDDLEGLYDSRLTRESRRKAPVDKVIYVAESYTWVKKYPAGRRKGTHRKRRERSPFKVLMLLRDGSTH